MVATRNVRLTLAYDGTDYRGFAESDGVRTVMGELRRAVETVVRTPVDLTGAGRTDAGVHAWGQVVSGQLPVDTDLRRLVRSINALCGPELSIRDAAWVTDDFSARFSATARTYVYRVWNDPAPHPLLARTTWHVPQSLDVDAMNSAAVHLIGDHDFSSFCRRPRPAEGAPEPSLVRRLHAARWATPETGAWGEALVQFEITASSFCHQMVRSIVGTLVDVGRGRRSAESIPDVLAACDRNAAGTVAPPVGLVLQAVDYSGARWDA
ncbi:MAG TPA: tRNA pseudouridine(38-40) synthase TruA [Ilumatobacteraceae bacterium]|nr:tRNA pseudouridine(38-40) synthase TruA [Ilumatobacteraceae bacterium]